MFFYLNNCLLTVHQSIVAENAASSLQTTDYMREFWLLLYLTCSTVVKMQRNDAEV